MGKNGGLIAQFTKSCLENSNQQYSAASNRTSDFISVADVVSANILAMKKLLGTNTKDSSRQFSKSNFSVYNIGSGEEISAFEATKLIRNLSGNESVKIKEGEGNSRRFFFDISAARKELGLSPNTLRHGLLEYIDNIKKMMVESY
jgi:nucleoside-diphosphate-sugar epimerase